MDLGNAELELEGEFEQVVGQLVSDKCEVDDVGESHVAKGVRLQVIVVQERSKEHLEDEFVMIG